MRFSCCLAISLLLAIAEALPSIQNVNRGMGRRSEPPFAGYVGCTDTQADAIDQAWEDARTLAWIPAKFNLDAKLDGEQLGWQPPFEGPCTGICDAGTLEVRFWGTKAVKNREHINFIRTIFRNIRNSDRVEASIHVACIDQPNPRNAMCEYDPGTGVIQKVGAYSYGTSQKPEDNGIVFCQPFFQKETLAMVVKVLEASPEMRKDSTQMFSGGAVLLHELTHLPYIEERFPRIVTDLREHVPRTGKDGGDLVYGVTKVEAFASRRSTWTHKNADTYAWYATTKYFENLFGITPDAAVTERYEVAPEGPTPSQDLLRKSKITCRNHPLSAPQHDGETSVESAIDKWCSDNDGKAVGTKPGTKDIFWRWGITQLDVPNRNSFWLRANMNGCGDWDLIIKDECVQALKDGLAECDPNIAITHGFRASIGCLDYHVDLSGVTKDGNPPWEEIPAFPPPELTAGKDMGGKAHYPECPVESSVRKKGRHIAEDDFDKALDAFCVDSAEIKGYRQYGNSMFEYPPLGQTQYYEQDQLKMQINLGADTIQSGADQPYDDMGWCQDYDWKMGRDDCRYALRNLYQSCNKDDFWGGQYTYRCVRYNMFYTDHF